MIKELLDSTEEMILFENKKPLDDQIHRTTGSHFDSHLQLLVKYVERVLNRNTCRMRCTAVNGYD